MIVIRDDEQFESARGGLKHTLPFVSMLVAGLWAFGLGVAFGAPSAQERSESSQLHLEVTQQAGSASSQAEVELKLHVRAQQTALQQDTRYPGASESNSNQRRLRMVVASKVDHLQWQTRLSDPDIDARELAFEELISLARLDPGVVLALESWSLDPKQPELAWTARMALRALEQVSHSKKVGWVEAHQGDASSSKATLAQVLRAIDVSAAIPLPERVQPLRSEQILSMYGPRAFRLPKRRQVYKLDFHPEGVVLTQFINVGGESRQQRYAAESAQALLEAHPHLREQVPGLSNILAKPFAAGSQFEWGRDRQLLRFDSSQANVAIATSRGAGSDSTQSSTIQRLGVKVTSVENDQLAAMLLGPGVGLLIERRVPGSPAEDLGLQRGDILFELGGVPLCSPEEISRLMAEVGGQEIRVKILDRYRLERELTWTQKQPD